MTDDPVIGMRGALGAPVTVPPRTQHIRDHQPYLKPREATMTTRTITAVGWTYDGIQVHIPVTVSDGDLWNAARTAADAVLLAGLKTNPQTTEYPKFQAHKVGWVVRRTFSNVDGSSTDTIDFYADKGLKDPLCKDYLDGDYKQEQFEKHTGLKLADITPTEAASITRDKPQQSNLQKYLTPVKGNVWIVVRDIGEAEQEKKSEDMRKRTGNSSASARRKYFSRFIGSADTDTGIDDRDDSEDTPPVIDTRTARTALGTGTGDAPRRLPTAEHPKPVVTDDTREAFDKLDEQPALGLEATEEEISENGKHLYAWAANQRGVSAPEVKKILGVTSYKEWEAQGRHLGDAKALITEAAKKVQF